MLLQFWKLSKCLQKRENKQRNAGIAAAKKQNSFATCSEMETSRETMPPKWYTISIKSSSTSMTLVFFAPTCIAFAIKLKLKGIQQNSLQDVSSQWFIAPPTTIDHLRVFLSSRCGSWLGPSSDACTWWQASHTSCWCHSTFPSCWKSSRKYLRSWCWNPIPKWVDTIQHPNCLVERTAPRMPHSCRSHVVWWHFRV